MKKHRQTSGIPQPPSCIGDAVVVQVELNVKLMDHQMMGGSPPAETLVDADRGVSGTPADTNPAPSRPPLSQVGPAGTTSNRTGIKLRCSVIKAVSLLVSPSANITQQQQDPDCSVASVNSGLSHCHAWLASHQQQFHLSECKFSQSQLPGGVCTWSV